MALTGCDIYDEPAQPAAERDPSRGWSSLADGQRSYALASGKPTGIEYVEGYESAVTRAGLERKPLLILFRAGWCRWCGEMTSQVLASREVVEHSRRFICVAVDADRDRAVCRAHGVRGFPTILLVSADGRELARRTGKVSPDALVGMLDEVVAPEAGLASPAPRTLR